MRRFIVTCLVGLVATVLTATGSTAHAFHTSHRVRARVGGTVRWASGHGSLAPLAHTNADGSSLSDAVTMTVEAGWNGWFRPESAWTPVHLTLRNQTGEVIVGIAEMPDNALAGAEQASPSRPAVYSVAVTLPAGGSKRVTLYVPGSDISNQMPVQFRSGSRVLASSTSFPTALTDHDVTIGVLTKDLSVAQWIPRTGPYATRMHAILLSPLTLDSMPEALGALDLIVITNVDSSQLDAAQRGALERYVRRGGSIMLIGGPDGAETLDSLSATLVPGRVSGSQTVTSLFGLRPFGFGDPPANPTTVSRLDSVTGAVIARQGNLPLVVRAPLGNGTITYAAFDPAVEPITHWSRGPALLRDLVVSAMPSAMRRASLPAGYGIESFVHPTISPPDIIRNLTGRGSESVLAVLLLAGLCLGVALLIGPANAWVARSARHPGHLWITVPALTIVSSLTLFQLGPHLRMQQAPLVSQIGMVEMDGGGSVYPATLYTSISTSSPQEQNLSLSTPALAEPVTPDLGAGGIRSNPAWRFLESGRGQAVFAAEGDSLTHTVVLHTSVSLPGGIRPSLSISSSGSLIGYLRNDSAIPLLKPVIVAGQAFMRLPTIAPGQSVHVEMQPRNGPERDEVDLLSAVYGSSSPVTPGVDTTSDLSSRIRHAVGVLPESRTLSMLGQILFLAWTDRPLLAMQLNGSAPQQQSLTLLVHPVYAEWSSGMTILRSGTLGASLVEERPARAHYPCCNPSAQSIYLGSGGSATFQFQFPHSRHLSVRSLELIAYAGGPDPTYTSYTGLTDKAGQAYDWTTQTWTDLHFHSDTVLLRNPNRYVSPSGALLVRLSALDDAHELTITDPRQDLQLQGTVDLG